MTASRSAPVTAAVLLTVAACLVGALGWPGPQRTPGGWQVADVPPSLLLLLLGTCAVSLVLGAALTRPGSLGSARATVTWWALCAASLAAQVWNDLYLASLGEYWEGVIPVLGWAFTAVPAFLVGRATRRVGREAHRRATLGTAVATLPPVGLGWSLAAAVDGVGSGLATGLWSAFLLGLVPLAFAVAITRPSRLPMSPVG